MALLIVLLSLLTTITLVECNHDPGLHHRCPPGYRRGQFLDATTQEYLLCWKVDWSDRTITFSAQVATTGWIGLGFSPTGHMPNSDMIIGWVKDKKGYLQDAFASSRSQPPFDGIQNVQLLSYGEAGGWTTLEFTRYLAACEPKDRSIEEGTTRVIFAYHPNDPVSSTTIVKHTASGRVNINLLSGTGNVEPARLEPDHKTIDILNPKVSVPARVTTYWCTPVKLPQLRSPVHMIGYEPLVQANHEQLVHHIVMYICSDGLAPFAHLSWDCNDPPANMPAAVQHCVGGVQLAAWAVGGRAVRYPAHVGLPLGGSSSARYLLMQTHYNNELMRSDLVDSSGMRVFYTPTRRLYNGAIVEIGHSVTRDSNVNLLLPPRRDDIIAKNICPGACTKVGLPSGGVNVTISMLHSHTAGRGIWIKHSRNGKQLPNIDSNYNYDFDFQDSVLLEEEVTILPGDDIQVFCDYDTKDRQHVTIGGESTMDEMCLAYLLVYPKPDLHYCFSRLPSQFLERYIDQAETKGYYVDLRNPSADPQTQKKQYLESIRNMKFNTEEAYHLWNQSFWSFNEREYICVGENYKNLMPTKPVNKYAALPTSNHSSTEASTVGTPKPCRPPPFQAKFSKYHGINAPRSSAFQLFACSFVKVVIVCTCLVISTVID